MAVWFHDASGQKIGWLYEMAKSNTTRIAVTASGQLEKRRDGLSDPSFLSADVARVWWTFSLWSASSEVFILPAISPIRISRRNQCRRSVKNIIIDSNAIQRRIELFPEWRNVQERLLSPVIYSSRFFLSNVCFIFVSVGWCLIHDFDKVRTVIEQISKGSVDARCDVFRDALPSSSDLHRVEIEHCCQQMLSLSLSLVICR